MNNIIEKCSLLIALLVVGVYHVIAQTADKIVYNQIVINADSVVKLGDNYKIQYVCYTKEEREYSFSSLESG